MRRSDSCTGRALAAGWRRDGDPASGRGVVDCGEAAPEVEDVERERAPHRVFDPRLLGERLDRFHEEAAHRVGRQRRNQLCRRGCMRRLEGMRVVSSFLACIPTRSLGRLTRHVKNIWTKSEKRRTIQPGSMITLVVRNEVCAGVLL